MTRHYVSLLGVSMLLLAACESGSSADPEGSAGSIVSVSAASPTVVLNAGASTTVPITVERTPGFARSVALTLSGLPNGLTYTFTPAALAFGQASSTLTLEANQGVQPGSYPLQLSASAAEVESKSAQFTVTVPTPEVSITVGTGAASVRLEDTVSLPVTVTRTGGGFMDPIELGISNLPSGVTARFTPSVLSGSATASALSLTPAIETALGARTAQVTASTISAAPKTIPLAVTILDASAPTFRIRVGAQSEFPFEGGIIERTVTVFRAGGFTGSVTLAAAGLPAGVVAEFTPPNVTEAASIMQLRASAGAFAGNHTITVRGAAAGLVERVVPATVIVSGVRLFPSTVTVQRGRSGQSLVSMGRYGSFADSSTVALASAAPGFTFTGLPVTIPQSNGGFGVSYGVTVDGSVAPGVYTFDVEARGRSQVLSTSTISVTVTN